MIKKKNLTRTNLLMWSFVSFISVSTLSSCSGVFPIPGGTSEKVVTANVAPTRARSEVQIWFTKVNGADLELVPVSRRVAQGDALEFAVGELLKGPTPAESDTGIASEIPKGAILLGSTHEGDSIELNLSKRFATGGGSTSFTTRMEQLARTVKEVAGTSKVYLNVEGQRLLESAGDGLEVKQPIN